MKLITLNTWGGRVREPFIDFVKKYKDTDIFCFQEMYENAEDIMAAEYPNAMLNGFSDLQVLLPEHTGYFRPALLGIYGVAMYIKKDLPVLAEGEVIIHTSESQTVTDGHHARNLQWIKFKLAEKDYMVINVHGLWNGMGKNDTPERISQSSIIKSFIDTFEGEKILCGDFNLNPDTESVKMLEQGMRNLIKEYSIQSTRTSFYEKPSKFADYIFTSLGIPVKNFSVLPEEVSDHSALFLEI